MEKHTRKRFLTSFLLVAVFHSAVVAQDEIEPPAGQPKPDPTLRRTLEDAPEVEKRALDRLLQSPSWPRRAVASLRLERFACEESRDRLIQLLHDPSWRVRCFAVRTLARRAVPQSDAWFETEDDPRVIRTTLRHRYQIDHDRLARGVRILSQSNDLEDKMLAVELAVAGGNSDLQNQALDIAKLIILRMDRVEAGSLSPRLALITGQPDLRHHWRWRQWLMKAGRQFRIQPAFALPKGTPLSLELPNIAKLESEAFIGLQDYMDELSRRELDLAICLDCTASMWGELAEAQGGIDDLMLFVGDVVSGLRIALIAYRDRHDDFETKAWDFTSDSATARRQLWELTAEGGGDRPEALHPALKLALTKLTWRKQSEKMLIIVGDAPPHVGFGSQCVQLARQGRVDADLTTHCIQADGEDVEHFPEIAEAGGGKCVPLKDQDSLIGEIAGLSFSDRYTEEFREFFQIYLELCR